MGCGGMSPKDGDCSNIYVAKNGSAQCLVGIHVSFNPYQAKAYGSALVRDQIEIILAEYETNLTQSEELTTAKIELPYGTYLASPDVVEYFGKHVKPVPGNVIVPEARCVNLGSASRRFIRGRLHISRLHTLMRYLKLCPLLKYLSILQ